MAKTKQKELHEYDVELEATFATVECATITVMAENAEQAEEIAISETEDGQHFDSGEFEGSEGFYDADFEALRVERTDGEEEEEGDDFD
tara:strand:- start:163 stop:429 length:267 start_codon:yes stop_codon:yes gene_type:complete